MSQIKEKDSAAEHIQNGDSPAVINKDDAMKIELLKQKLVQMRWGTFKISQSNMLKANINEAILSKYVKQNNHQIPSSQTQKASKIQ